MKYLVFDISNMLYRSFYSQRNESDDVLAGLATHLALTTLNKYFKLYKPSKVVMAFDRHSWRKDYTASDLCVSKKPYKGNRRQDMTQSQKIKYAKFMEHMREFEQLIFDNTTIIALKEDNLEADDLIAGFAQIYSDTDNEIIIISTDSDLLQLTRYTNVKVISPDTDKEQSLAEYDNDPVYYVFQKCVRGDPTDNVQSAYPKVRQVKIAEAYKDPYACVALMEHKWKEASADGREFVVKDLFNENKILIDLECQPDDIRLSIFNAVEQEMSREKSFSMFFMLKFLGKYQLIKIKDSLDLYLPLLSR